MYLKSANFTFRKVNKKTQFLYFWKLNDNFFPLNSERQKTETSFLKMQS